MKKDKLPNAVYGGIDIYFDDTKEIRSMHSIDNWYLFKSITCHPDDARKLQALIEQGVYVHRYIKLPTDDWCEKYISGYTNNE